MEEVNKNTELDNTDKKFNISDVSHSFLFKDLSKEENFFSEQRFAMIDTTMMLFEDKLSDDDLIKLKKSFERLWNNGLRFGLYKNCD